MIKLYSPQNEGQLALLRSVLEAAQIPYFVHNDHFGSLQVGPRIDLLNAKTIMVPEKFREQAAELVADYLSSTEENSPKKRSVTDRIRMCFEALLFGWFVPGRRNRTADQSDNDAV